MGDVVKVCRVLQRLDFLRRCVNVWRETEKDFRSIATRCDESDAARCLAAAQDRADSIEHALTLIRIADRSLACLSADVRQIVETHYIKGIPWDSVADSFGIPVEKAQRIGYTSLQQLAPLLIPSGAPTARE